MSCAGLLAAARERVILAGPMWTKSLTLYGEGRTQAEVTHGGANWLENEWSLTPAHSLTAAIRPKYLAPRVLIRRIRFTQRAATEQAAHNPDGRRSPPVHWYGLDTCQRPYQRPERLHRSDVRDQLLPDHRQQHRGNDGQTGSSTKSI